ncbi:MAG: nitroreductase family protein, partial [Candidatus Heimdallarchaeaceae archaeon]
KNKLDKLVGQKFILKGAVIFLWATTPYRMEWRYSITSSKVIAIEAGHICQNLYLACETIDIGTYKEDRSYFWNVYYAKQLCATN